MIGCVLVLMAHLRGCVCVCVWDDKKQDSTLTLTNGPEGSYLIYNELEKLVTEMMPGSCSRSYPAAGIKGLTHSSGVLGWRTADVAMSRWSLVHAAADTPFRTRASLRR